MNTSDIIAIVAALAAVGSAIYARGANKRADDALDLQKRIDAREREFREVSWDLSWQMDQHSGGRARFYLQNTGVTDAEGVSIVFYLPAGPELHSFDGVEPYELANGEIEDSSVKAENGWDIDALEAMRYRIHWSSPLGFAQLADGPGPRWNRAPS